MQILLLLCLCSVAFAATFYETLNDNFHYGSADHKLVKEHVNCLLDKGPCDAFVQSFKDVIPEAAATACVKCKESQKVIAKSLIEATHKYFPEDLLLLRSKYDPGNKNWDGLVKIFDVNLQD